MITDLLLRIALAGALVGLIGIERQLRAKEAGLRTHILDGYKNFVFAQLIFPLPSRTAKIITMN